jgi:hypothetical protein
MKIIISKNTVQQIADEVVEIASIVSGEEVKKETINFKKAAKASKKEGLVNLNVENKKEDFVININDEVFFIVLESYRVLAKPLAVIYSGFKMLMSAEIINEYTRVLEKLSRRK